MLEPWLQSKGLNDVNQVMAYFAVTKLGESPIDGTTDTFPKGLTSVYGKWVSDVAKRLVLLGALGILLVHLANFFLKMPLSVLLPFKLIFLQ